MATGFLGMYLAIVGAWALLGMLLGLALAKQNRMKGAIIGVVVGVVLGGMFASVAIFQSSAPREVPVVVAE